MRGSGTVVVRVRRSGLGALGSTGAIAGLVAGLLCAFVAPPAHAAEACLNEAIRAEQGAVSTALPDCRAYEMVSPPGSVPSPANDPTIAAVDGERFAYEVREPFPGSDQEGLFLLAARGADGWSVHNTTPAQGGLRNTYEEACIPSAFYSAELTSAVISDGWTDPHGEVCEGDTPPLVAGEPRGTANLFLHDEEDNTYQLIDDVPAGVPATNALLNDATPDLSHVIFSDGAKLTPKAPAGGLYEWSEGLDRLVTFLPDGEPVTGALVSISNGYNGNSALYKNAVSADGETVFFYAGGDLYARLHADRAATASGECNASEPELACTVQLDAAEAGAEGPGGGGGFQYASADGSRVYFTDTHRLTMDATAFGERPDLYEYNLQTGALADLTATSASTTADVLGVVAASVDGSYVYFVATGVLSEQANSLGEKAVRGQPNLYLRHAGVTTFVAEGVNLRVSADGQYLAFSSTRKLTGYDNEPLASEDCEGSCAEIFLYDAANGEIACVSCAPDGEPPTGPAGYGGFPPLPQQELTVIGSPTYLPRDVLDDGRVFFDTRSPLVPQATNGEVNVYEYEGGTDYLVSGGAGSGRSEFLDASASGADVFFSTSQGLLEGDTDNQSSVYDARVDGGFPPALGQGEQAGACESQEACESPPSEPPAQLVAASSVLSAGGNLLAPPTPVTPPQSGSQPGVGKRSTATRAQLLAKALKACAKKSKHARASCRARAQRQFGVKQSKRTGVKGAVRRRGTGSIDVTKGSVR
jgi:WD40-like Beta Propeller Repeat